MQQKEDLGLAMCVKTSILGCDMQQEEDLASAMRTCDVGQNFNILYSDMQQEQWTKEQTPDESGITNVESRLRNAPPKP